MSPEASTAPAVAPPSGILGRLRATQGTFAGGSLITVVLNGAAAVCFGVGSILIARVMGPRETGHLVWFGTATAIFSVFADVLGIYYSSAYLIARGSGGFPLPRIRGTVLAYATCLGAVVAAACVLSPVFPLVRLFGFESPSGRALVGLNILGLVVVAQIRGLYWGSGSFLLLGVVTFIKSGGYALLAVALVYGLGWRAGSQVAVAQVVTTWVCVFGSLVFFLVRGIARPDFAYLKACMRVGWRGAGVYFASFLHLRLDQYLVNDILGPTALGLYGVVSSLGEVIVQGPTMLGSVLFSVVAADRDQASAAKATVKRTLVVMLGVAVLIIPLAVFAPDIVRLVYGEKFMESARLLLFFLPGTLFLSGLVMINSYLAAIGYPVYQLQAACAAVVVNAACNLLLLPRIGVAGAPISNSLSCAVWLVLIGGYLVLNARRRSRQVRI